ncbi:IS3 family transposase [Corynebacterium coyleae]|nr:MULTISPECIES: IS3 family transposase [Corynebacterium]MDK8240628.1 IS3 family transposase [Corynebacterium coyleae]
MKETPSQYRVRGTPVPTTRTRGTNYPKSTPATFYRFQARGFGPTPAELDEAYTAHRLFELWEANRRVYGRRKLWKAAHRAGWNIGRDQVQRLMNILGIAGVLRRKTTRTTVADPSAERFPDRIQRAWSQAPRSTTDRRIEAGRAEQRHVWFIGDVIPVGI